MEKIVQQQITSFLHETSALSDSQFGFRKGRSCINLLLSTIDDWLLARDAKKVYSRSLHWPVKSIWQRATRLASPEASSPRHRGTSTVLVPLLSERQVPKSNQGKSSSTPVTSNLSKTFHQICLWLHQLVKTRKRTEDSVIYLLGNPQRDVGDWLTLINKLNTIATYSIPTATCQQQQTTPNHACACRPEVLPYRKKRINDFFYFLFFLFFIFVLFLFLYTTAQTQTSRLRERERDR